MNLSASVVPLRFVPIPDDRKRRDRLARPLAATQSFVLALFLVVQVSRRRKRTTTKNLSQKQVLTGLLCREESVSHYFPPDQECRTKASVVRDRSSTGDDGSTTIQSQRDVRKGWWPDRSHCSVPVSSWNTFPIQPSSGRSADGLNSLPSNKSGTGSFKRSCRCPAGGRVWWVPPRGSIRLTSLRSRSSRIFLGMPNRSGKGRPMPRHHRAS